MLKFFTITCIVLTIVLIHLNYQSIAECNDKDGAVLKTVDGLGSCIEVKKVK